jgi:hypothetical protein
LSLSSLFSCLDFLSLSLGSLLHRTVLHNSFSLFLSRDPSLSFSSYETNYFLSSFIVIISHRPSPDNHYLPVSIPVSTNHPTRQTRVPIKSLLFDNSPIYRSSKTSFVHRRSSSMSPHHCSHN